MCNTESFGGKNKIDKEEKIAMGEITPRNRLEIQIRPAEKLFDRKFGPIDRILFHEDLQYRNRIMEFWSKKEDGKESYSSVYRLLEESDWFKNHPKLQGDIFRITIDDVLDFIRENNIPISE